MDKRSKREISGIPRPALSDRYSGKSLPPVTLSASQITPFTKLSNKQRFAKILSRSSIHDSKLGLEEIEACGLEIDEVD